MGQFPKTYPDLVRAKPMIWLSLPPVLVHVMVFSAFSIKHGPVVPIKLYPRSIRTTSTRLASYPRCQWHDQLPRFLPMSLSDPWKIGFRYCRRFDLYTMQIEDVASIPNNGNIFPLLNLPIEPYERGSLHMSPFFRTNLQTGGLWRNSLMHIVTLFPRFRTEYMGVE